METQYSILNTQYFVLDTKYFVLETLSHNSILFKRKLVS